MEHQEMVSQLQSQQDNVNYDLLESVNPVGKLQNY